MTKKNEWFEEVFLPSIKDRKWLTEKQVNICFKYMTQSKYYADKLMYAIGNTEYKVMVYPKGYGEIFVTEYPHNIEEYIR